MIWGSEYIIKVVHEQYGLQAETESHIMPTAEEIMAFLGRYKENIRPFSRIFVYKKELDMVVDEKALEEKP